MSLINLGVTRVQESLLLLFTGRAVAAALQLNFILSTPKLSWGVGTYLQTTELAEM